jgi:hypothetical protein
MSSNIEQSIRQALTQIFTDQLITHATSSRLALHTLRLWPLQDDPTEVAPYLVFGTHPQLGRVKDQEILEIGGPTYKWTYFRAVCGTPIATTREEATDDIEELTTKIEQVLEAHYNLNNVLAPGLLLSADGSEAVVNNKPNELLLGTATRIYGGEGEFYGEGKLVWRYSFQRVRNW